MCLPGTGSRLSAALVLALLVTACDTGDQPLGPDLTPDPSYAISDGANLGGNANFYFLPPMVKMPATSGVFDPYAAPVVKICEWNAAADPPACIDPPLRTFTTPDDIHIDLEDELYGVNWNTDAVPAVGTNKAYRIFVYSGGILLGFADIEFTENKGQAKKGGDPDETVITLVDGRTLPIKFRIEVGAESHQPILGCDPTTTTAIVDCDVVVVPSGTPGQATVEDLDGTGDFAAQVNTPAVEGQEVFLTLLLLPRTDFPVPADPALPPLNQFPYFVSVTAVDENGLPIQFATDGPGGSGAELDLCQIEPHPLPLSLFRVDDDGFSLYPSQLSTANCPIEEASLSPFDRHGHPTGHGPFDVLLDRGKRTLASLFLPQPLRALHGGLNGRGIDKFSEWGSTDLIPNLEIVSPDFAASPSPIPAGGTVSVTAYTPENNGTAASGLFRNGFYLSLDEEITPADVLMGTNFNSLAAGDSYTWPGGSVAIPINTVPGPYYLGVLADDQNVVVETNDGDNYVSTPLEVGETLWQPLIQCAPDPSSGGEPISRGFYVPDFQASTLTAVELYMSADIAGEYELFLEGHYGEYEGERIVSGSTRANVTLNGDPNENRRVTFGFRGPQDLDPVGGTLAFKIVSGGISNPGGNVWYNVGFDEAECPIVQTEGTTPPLDTDYRYGIAATVWGTPAPGFEVSGTVQYSSNFLYGILVELRQGSATGTVVQEVTTDEGGQYAFFGVTPGEYWVRVNGGGEYIGWVAQSYTVTTTDLTGLARDLPKVIDLLLPANGATGVATQPLLEWVQNPQATTYSIQINQTQGWVLAELGTSLTTSYTPQSPLHPNVEYAWQVDARDGSLHHVGTTMQAFTLTPGGNPTWTFSGEIGAVTTTPPEPFEGVSPGDPWTLIYTFDPAASDVDPSETAGQYQDLVSVVTLTIGGESVTGAPGTSIPLGYGSVIAVNLGSGFADYTAQAGLPGATQSSGAWAQVALWDSEGTPFETDLVTQDIATAFGSFDPKDFFLRAPGSSSVLLTGTVNSFTVN